MYLSASVARSRGKCGTGCFVIKLWGWNWGTIRRRGVHPGLINRVAAVSGESDPPVPLAASIGPSSEPWGLSYLLLPLVGVLSKFSNRKLTLCMNCLSEAFSRNGPHHDYQRISDAMQTM